MNFGQTLLLYLLLGAGVAIGFAARSAGPSKSWLTILGAWVFWPLFVPLLVEQERVDSPVAVPLRANRDELSAQVRLGIEQLDRFTVSLSNLAPPDLPERLVKIKTTWTKQLEWLIETDTLLSDLHAAPAELGQIEELKRMQTHTEVSLDRCLNSIRELAVAVQMLKAPGANRVAGLSGLEQTLQAILELEEVEVRLQAARNET